MIEDHVTRPLVAMKASHEFRRHTFAARLDWRTDCSRLGLQFNEQQIKMQLRKVFADALNMRISHACLPVFQSLDRIETLLKSLKYVIILAVLLCHINPSEARYAHRHRHSHDVPSTTVYEPDRVAVRETPNVFDTGYVSLRYPNSYILWDLPAPEKEQAAPSVECPTLTQPVMASTYITEDGNIYPRMLIALGVLMLFAAFGQRVTGRWDDASYRKHPETSPVEVVTLVETRRWLPRWVSAAYCVVKHNLRLR